MESKAVFLIVCKENIAKFEVFDSYESMIEFSEENMNYIDHFNKKGYGIHFINLTLYNGHIDTFYRTELWEALMEYDSYFKQFTEISLLTKLNLEKE